LSIRDDLCIYRASFRNLVDYLIEGLTLKRGNSLGNEAAAMGHKPTVISLFSGCGGSDQGLVEAGFEVLMANDIMEFACRTYSLNFPDVDVKCANVRSIKSFPAADLLVGCYPCQGFSQGGVRDCGRRINYLYREFLRVLKTVKPKAFIVENVSGMTLTNFQHLLRNQVTCFRFAGYSVAAPRLLDACGFGCAQHRRRVFIVGIRSSLGVQYEFPEPSHGKRRCPYRTQRQVLKGMPEWPEGLFYDKGFHWYYLSRNRRHEWDEPSPTIVANARHMPLHPMSPPLRFVGKDKWAFETNAPARRFSYEEAKILQGFPKSFKLPEGGSLMQKYTVIGNAVPPPLFKAVALALPDIW